MPPFDPDEFLRTYKGPGITLDPNRALAPKTTIGQPGFDPEAFLKEAGQTGTSGTIPPGKPEQRSVGERLQTGFADPFYGAAQIGARMQGPGEEWAPQPLSQAQRDERIAAIDKQIADRERAIQKRAGEGTDWWRLVGQGANPTLYAPALVGGLPGAALTGMTAGILQPDPNATDNFAERKAKEAVAGGLSGLAGGLVTHVAGRVVSPIVGRAAQELMNRGVQLTPGRLAGQMFSRMEDAARSIPFLGHFIRSAADRSEAGFNLAGINTALDQIGATLPRGTQAGREAMERADTLLDAEYRRLIASPNFRMQIDPQFNTDMANIMADASELPIDMQRQFTTILNRRLGNRLAQGGGELDGQMLQDVQSVFREFQTKYGKRGDPDQQTMADRFGDVRDAMLDALERQHPQQGREFRDLRTAYAMFTRFQDASSRRAGAAGKEGAPFSPMDLSAAVKKGDQSRRKAAYARGDALLQEFAEWGQFVLPSKVPDSGTPERWLWAMLFGGAATGGHYAIPSISDPAFMLAGGALTAGSAAYTRPGIALINYYADSAPWRRALRSGLQQHVTPAMGVPAALSFDEAGNLVTPANAAEDQEQVNRRLNMLRNPLAQPGGQ